MDEQLNTQIEMQNKISALVKQRQEQITELKMYYDPTNVKKYKEIALLGRNLSKFDEIFTKGEYRMKCENLLSLALSLGKILDLNNSIKTILISIKIFDEHNHYLSQNAAGNSNGKNNFISKSLNKTDAVPLSQSAIIKKRISGPAPPGTNETGFKVMKDFYSSLYKNDSNFFTEFNKYLAFQTDSKSKSNVQFKTEDFKYALYKVMSAKNGNFYKFYSRVNSSFDLDYSSVVLSACDIFFMIYNKMMDKICYNPNLIDYIQELDNLIARYFIYLSSEDLRKLAEYIVKKDMNDLISNLDKVYY